jgi:hypothetical protein
MVISTLDPTALARANITSSEFAKISPSLTMSVATTVFAPTKEETAAANQSFYDLANTSFGYLIPTAYSNDETNPASALGVVFDSCTASTTNEPFLGQVKDASANGMFAKATVIAGGRFYKESAERGDSPQKDPVSMVEQFHTFLAEKAEKEGVQQPGSSDAFKARLLQDFMKSSAQQTLREQLGAPTATGFLEAITKSEKAGLKDGDAIDDAAFLAEESIVQHGIGHYAAYQREVRELDKKFGAGKVWLSGRAAHGNGLTQCVDGAVQAAVKVLMESYGFGKIEEIVGRIRTQPRM